MRLAAAFVLGGIAALPGFADTPPAIKLLKSRPASHEIRMENRVPVPMRDGVILYADLYLPKNEGRYPVIVSRTPYSVDRWPDNFTVPAFFASRGYVFVFQDVRGRHESDGEWVPYRNETADGYDTIEWAARQPWSNGKVGMQGASYLGHVQWQAARTAPPHLVTVFPNVAMTSFYHHGLTTSGGFRLAMRFGWGVARNSGRLMQNPGIYEMKGDAASLGYERLLTNLPLIDLPKLAGRTAPFWKNWIEHPDYDEYWKPLNVENDFERIGVPVHTYGGWYDVNLQGTVNGYVGMSRKGKTRESRERSHMIVGPWTHGPSRRAGELDFGELADIDTRAVELRWFDYWLKGDRNGLVDERPVKVFVMGRNVWRQENEFPLAGTQYTKMYLDSGGSANTLQGDGRLSWKPPSSNSLPDRYRYDPMNPVPSLGGNSCCGAPTPVGAADQRPVERRGDVLVYTSEVLTREIEVTGPVKVVLYASSDAPDTDWIAKLVDVAPDGRAYNVAEGFLRARHREGLDRPKWMEPGTVYEFGIDLIATSNAFLPGHRIRLDVTSSHFPQFARAQNVAEPFGRSGKIAIANQTVHHSSARPSHVLLPVIPAGR